MARNAEAPSRMEILLLTSLARAPMHGYELKLELQYKHVEWWAKCEHGHLYAALARLERGKYIRKVARRGGRSNQRVLAITAAGRRRVIAALAALGAQPNTTYFDIDMFLAGCHLLPRDVAMSILDDRNASVRARLAEARTVEAAMRAYVPAVGQLIMQHRIRYLEAEIAFLDTCAGTLRTQVNWSAFLADTPIQEFVRTTRVPLERG